MHRLNFCTSLCLPKDIEGYKVRGINAIHEFGESFIIPMARSHTKLHILYSSRPITLEGKVLKFEDLDTKEKADSVSETAIAPDFAVDPDERCNDLVQNREDNLAYIAESLLKKDFERVVFWSNNGIGPTVAKDSNEDGILRDENNIAYACRLDSKVAEEHNRNLKSTYQKIAHDHIHIAPDTTGFGEILVNELEKAHDSHLEGDFEFFRDETRDNNTNIPCISICSVDSKTDLSKPLQHKFYLGKDSHFKVNPAGFSKNIVLKVSKEKLGIDFEEKEVFKEHIKLTAEFYKNLLD